ncbi:MAG: hypothetical protein ACYC25_11150 [Paludibacter sp.]
MKVIHCPICFCRSAFQNKGQVSPESLLRAATQVNPQPPKILTPRSSGFAQSFCLPPHNQPCCCFFLSHFLQSTLIWHIAFSRSSKKINKPFHPQDKKDVCTPTATTVLHLRQKKTQN